MTKIKNMFGDIIGHHIYYILYGTKIMGNKKAKFIEKWLQMIT